jgi:hypothetical protein
MKRTTEQYETDIRAVLRTFCERGDRLHLTNIFNGKQKCEMCGRIMDIRRCYELRNGRSGQAIICGSRCIVNYAIVLQQMGLNPVISFPEMFQAQAEIVNRRFPGTFIASPPTNEIDREFATDLCDCGCELTYCEDCDNEVCSECQSGCTCDGAVGSDPESCEDGDDD